jgi:hypothetical protein
MPGKFCRQAVSLFIDANDGLVLIDVSSPERLA